MEPQQQVPLPPSGGMTWRRRLGIDAERARFAVGTDGVYLLCATGRNSVATWREGGRGRARRREGEEGKPRRVKKIAESPSLFNNGRPSHLQFLSFRAEVPRWKSVRVTRLAQVIGCRSQGEACRLPVPWKIQWDRPIAVGSRSYVDQCALPSGRCDWQDRRDRW